MRSARLLVWEAKPKLSYNASYNWGGGLRISHNATYEQRIKGFGVTEIKSCDIQLVPYCIIMPAGTC